jgi:hypothetical protein
MFSASMDAAAAAAGAADCLPVAHPRVATADTDRPADAAEATNVEGTHSLSGAAADVTRLAAAVTSANDEIDARLSTSPPLSQPRNICPCPPPPPPPPPLAPLALSAGTGTWCAGFPRRPGTADNPYSPDRPVIPVNPSSGAVAATVAAASLS